MAEWLISVEDKVFYLCETDEALAEKLEMLEEQSSITTLEVYQRQLLCAKTPEGKWRQSEV